MGSSTASAAVIAGALSQVGGVGGNLLAELVVRAWDRLRRRSSDRRGAGQELLRDALAVELAEWLALPAPTSATLRDEVAGFLRGVEAVRVALTATIEESATEVRDELIRELREFGAVFTEFRWALDEVNQQLTFIALDVVQTKETLSRVEQSITRHEGVEAVLTQMLERLSEAVISLTNERDNLRVQSAARETQIDEGVRNATSLADLDDLRRQLRDAQERLRATHELQRRTAARLAKVERQLRLAERLRDEALKQAASVQQRLSEIDRPGSALPSTITDQTLTNDHAIPLMGNDDQQIAEGILRRVDTVLHEEGEALIDLRRKLTSSSPTEDSSPGNTTSSSTA